MSLEQEMKVLKRNGKFENIGFDKILKRVKSIGTESINYMMEYLPQRLMNLRLNNVPH